MTSKALACKLIILGDCDVGKTTLVHQFTQKEFCGGFKSTIGVDFTSYTLEIDSKVVEFNIWDTSGQERFHSISSTFYRGVNACIFVYDITKQPTFNNLELWMKQLYDNAVGGSELFFPIVIFANKCDLKDENCVEISEAREKYDSQKWKVFEVSAKTGENVQEGFIDIGNQFLKSYSSEPHKPVGLKHQLQTKQKKEDCC